MYQTKLFKKIDPKIVRFKNELQRLNVSKCLSLKMNTEIKMHIKSLLQCFSNYKDCGQIINNNSKKIRKLMKNS